MPNCLPVYYCTCIAWLLYFVAGLVLWWTAISGDLKIGKCRSPYYTGLEVYNQKQNTTSWSAAGLSANNQQYNITNLFYPELFLGDWYEVLRTKNAWEWDNYLSMKCTRIRYTPFLNNVDRLSTTVHWLNPCELHWPFGDILNFNMGSQGSQSFTGQQFRKNFRNIDICNNEAQDDDALGMGQHGIEGQSESLDLGPKVLQSQKVVESESKQTQQQQTLGSKLKSLFAMSQSDSQQKNSYSNSESDSKNNISRNTLSQSAQQPKKPSDFAHYGRQPNFPWNIPIIGEMLVYMVTLCHSSIQRQTNIFKGMKATLLQKSKSESKTTSHGRFLNDLDSESMVDDGIHVNNYQQLITQNLRQYESNLNTTKSESDQTTSKTQQPWYSSESQSQSSSQEESEQHSNTLLNSIIQILLTPIRSFFQIPSFPPQIFASQLREGWLGDLFSTNNDKFGTTWTTSTSLSSLGSKILDSPVSSFHLKFFEYRQGLPTIGILPGYVQHEATIKCRANLVVPNNTNGNGTSHTIPQSQATLINNTNGHCQTLFTWLPLPYLHHVVRTDYQTSATVYSCFSLAGIMKYEYAWVLKRNPIKPKKKLLNQDIIDDDDEDVFSIENEKKYLIERLGFKNSEITPVVTHDNCPNPEL